MHQAMFDTNLYNFFRHLFNNLIHRFMNLIEVAVRFLQVGQSSGFYVGQGALWPLS